jgi:uncharacterized protein YndB with AHSA1/START domain
MQSPIQFDPKLDLILERIIAIKPELVWRCWTEPELLVQWFCPRPWQTIACEIDLIPGGQFKTTMQGPEGQTIPNCGTFLEIIPNRKLVWTSALLPGFRPHPKIVGEANFAEFVFSAMIVLEPHPTGCKYTAIVIHPDEESCNKHQAMGFHQGWSIALDQLIAVAHSLATVAP